MKLLSPGILGRESYEGRPWEYPARCGWNGQRIPDSLPGSWRKAALKHLTTQIRLISRMVKHKELMLIELNSLCFQSLQIIFNLDVFYKNIVDCLFMVEFPRSWHWNGLKIHFLICKQTENNWISDIILNWITTV